MCLRFYTHTGDVQNTAQNDGIREAHADEKVRNSVGPQLNVCGFLHRIHDANPKYAVYNLAPTGGFELLQRAQRQEPAPQQPDASIDTLTSARMVVVLVLCWRVVNAIDSCKEG